MNYKSLFKQELNWPTPLKSLPFHQVHGLIKSVQHKYKIEITDAIINEFKEAVQEVYSPEIEFEWPDEAAYDWWRNLNSANFMNNAPKYSFSL